MKKMKKVLLSFALILGMVVTMLQGSIPTSAEETDNPMRALWLRPKETTKAQVEAAVEKIADAGINTIFLETVYDGYTIFPVEYDATYQRPLFNGFDVLQAYIDACHSRGIQLHCWVESFFIGMEYVDAGGPVYKAHKSWLLTDNNGNNWEDTMYGKMYFLNPARPECRNWIVNLYKILVENYDIDGIQLDYVRYPQKTSSVDWGYDEYTINKFIAEKGFDPTNAAEGSYEAQAFVAYKQQQVTKFVKACATELKAINPDLILSLSVYPFYQDGKDLFMQSAELWMSEGYGDLVVPMAYYENQIDSITNNTLKVAGGSEMNTVIGLSAQNGFTTASLERQTNAVLNKGVGVAYFEYESFFSGGYANVLKDSALKDTEFNIDPEVYKTSVDMNADAPKGQITFVNGYDWTAQTDNIYAFASEDAEATISTITGQTANTYAWFNTVVLEENENGEYVVKATGYGSDTGAITEGLGEGKIIIMAHSYVTSYTETYTWLNSLMIDDIVTLNVEWSELAAINASAPEASIYFEKVEVEEPEEPIIPDEPEDPVEPEDPEVPEDSVQITFANGYDWTAQVNQIYMFATDDATASVSSITGQTAATYAWFHTVVLEENADGNYEVVATGFGGDTGAIAETLGEGKIVLMAHDSTSYADSFNWLKGLAVGEVLTMHTAWDDIQGTYGSVEVYFSVAEDEPVIPEDPVEPENHENAIHYEAVEASCHYNGCIEYWYCPECEGVWADEALTQLTNLKNIVVPATGGEVVAHEAVEPGCHSNGNIAYWTCAECEQVWQDEACTQLTNSKNVILPATGSENLVHYEAVEAGCHYNGSIEYWYCPDCEGFWTDEACTQVTNSKSVVLPATGEGNVVHMEAVEPGCHFEGNIEYWVCYDCEQVWQDEALTQLTNIKNVVLPATGSENVEHVEAVEATCYTGGNVEYWHCLDCEGYWTDEACTQLTNAKNVILPVIEHGNKVHFDAVEPACHYNGNVEYWYCPDCEGFWTDEACTEVTNSKSVILPAVGGEEVHMEAVEPGCHFDGNIEYWVCYDCEQVWADEALTQLTNSKNVVVPATGSENFYHVEAVASTCFSEGNIEYWYCDECEQVWQDEALTQLTNRKNVVVPALEHANVVHMEAVEPGCHYNGNVEHWFCPDCEGFWMDEDLTQVTNSKSVTIPAVGGEVVYFEAIEPGCHMDGQIEHWVCYECEQVWQDEALTQLTNIKNVVVPATGSENLVHYEAVEPGCHYNGNVEYWYCPDCEGFWTDAACTEVTNSKSVILPAVGGEVVHMEAVEPGCHYEGNIAYWTCPDCEQVWQDEALTQLTNIKNVVLPELGGEVVHVEAKAPTATENGNIEYWYCEDCEQVWQDEARTQLTNFKNVILPATGEVADNDDATTAPETGDSAPIVVYVVTLMVAAAALVAALKKRFA